MLSIRRHRSCIYEIMKYPLKITRTNKQVQQVDKIYIQKSIVFLYAGSKQSENEINLKIPFPFIIVSKRVTYLGVSLT